ncbi:MAG: undecaprenyl-diphosphate phosphatase [Oscillospiraceae bacterium]|nr:undecaprenyl-diphosphate phosphatase [Oscillospiraceae bacterium]
MSVANAITAGIIYALTELLGLSGSGHLAVMNSLFDLRMTEMNLIFKAFTEFAVFLALILAWRKEIAEMIRDTAGLTGFGGGPVKKGTRYPGARLLFMQAVATLPLLLMLPFRRAYFTLWGHTSFVGAMLLLNGLILAVCERMQPGKKGIGAMKITDALLIGICQAVAVIPGISRLAVTVTASQAEGIRKTEAIRFGMLLAIPAMFGSSVLSLADAASTGIESAYLPAYLWGGVAALMTGFFTVFGFKTLVRRRGYGGLAYYSWVIGVLAIILTLIF